MKRIVIITLLVAALLCGCGERADGPKLEIVFFDVGKADSFLMQYAGETLLMDAGKTDDGEYVAARLREMGVQTIDHFVITHFDKDHVGGAAQIITEFEVKNIYQPEYMKESGETAAYLSALERSGAEAVIISKGYSLFLGAEGGGTLVNLHSATAAYEHDPSNNSSLMASVYHGEVSLLFTGDIEKERINDWLNQTVHTELDYDLLKVPHHGKYEKILPEFFERVKAEYAVITSSDKNPEDAETLAALEKAGVKCYLTKNGDVYLESNGKRLVIRQ